MINEAGKAGNIDECRVIGMYIFTNVSRYV